jgi:hypothetical protein
LCVDGNAANLLFREREGVSESAADCLEHAQRFAHDFRSNPVAGEYGDSCSERRHVR